MRLNKHLSRRAFTLVELLVVMSIILILVGIALPAANSAKQKAKDTEVGAGCSTIQRSLEEYAIDHNNCYPGAHWEKDSNGEYHVGPGVIGATPSYDQGIAQKDFYVPKEASDQRGPYLADGTPNPQVLDSLVVGGYLPDYPANPFLRATGGTKAQMGNLFLFNPILGTTVPTPTNSDSLDWNRYTAPGEHMRVLYDDAGRGHFTYIPLKPVHTSGGLDFAANWGSITDAQASAYYNNVCHGYILVGWGHSRMEDSTAKGLSEKYWNNSLGYFDFDASQNIDPMEQVLSDASASGIMYSEVQDSNNSVGSFGGVTPSNAPDIDPAFFGAVFFQVNSSTK